jgi:hypothetical protein
MLKSRVSAFLVALTLVACSSGGDTGSSGVGFGQFKDSNTQGLNYVSGDLSGVTLADGSFEFVVGGTVTFSVGGVELGTTGGKSVVTPVDLVTRGSSSSPAVQNIVRFLMTLDSNGDPSDGITISPKVQAAAVDWQSVAFDGGSFQTALNTSLEAANAADPDNAANRIIRDAVAAQNHLESTLLCSYAGAYEGTFSGGDRGSFGILVDATSGEVRGMAYSDIEQISLELTGDSPITFDQNASFVSGNISSGATFSGQFDSVNGLSGTWENTLYGDGGSYSGSRIGGAADAQYRFTGTFSSDASSSTEGLITLDINSANEVTGQVYDSVDDVLSSLSGSVSGTALTATVAGSVSVTGTLDRDAGTLSGTWTDDEAGESGDFTGSGCRLN